MSQKITIRDAVEGDLPGVLAIYNDVIATTTAVYSEAPVTLDDRRNWWQSRVAASYPVLVAADRSGILGFSSFGDFRAWPCYRSTVEHSVHVRADRRGEGLGSQLLIPLFSRAAALQKHMMIAAIDAQNEPSLQLHQRLGFERAGVFREVGFKFGRWLDLVFMQRRIDEA
jgi:phosphinothricin acetyltransferase